MDSKIFDRAVAYLNNELNELFLVQEEKEAMGRLLDLIYSSEAPASSSSSKHGAFDGGLAVHVSHVYRLAKGMITGTATERSALITDIQSVDEDRCLLSTTQLSSCSLKSLFKVSVIHDLNKVRTIDGHPYYVPNMLKSGSRSAAKPWEISERSDPFASIRSYISSSSDEVDQVAHFLEFLKPDFMEFREGLVSLAVAASVSPEIMLHLSQEEKNAVILHDGAYPSRSGLMGKESILQIVLHSADMIASRFFC